MTTENEGFVLKTADGKYFVSCIQGSLKLTDDLKTAWFTAVEDQANGMKRDLRAYTDRWFETTAYATEAAKADEFTVDELIELRAKVVEASHEAYHPNARAYIPA